ncbi:thermonuclease family protein [Pseudarthrobacter defluvii]|uniref:thermonuclease family protein n=1 Tax=Pseudarthrobacter defluvii TaxID=410837 RepID=UPI0025761A47|nr:thermonuclease family protein [Pseudarthrobacter defluvii]WJH24365.1 thermonuclease family protein [Pseudarthrobacter defluvii]
MKKLIIASLAATGLVAGSFAAGAAANAGTGTVVRVVDGDTLVVSINNGDHTIRLLNIDTPETKDPNQPVECLGPEASKYLEGLLPKGTQVRLEFDAERHDKYGRTLAGVFTADGSLVNAKIAQQGLGIPVEYGGNRKFLPPVQAAYEEARAAKSGLFSESIGCTLPAQLAETTKGLETATEASPATTSAAAGAAAGVLASKVAAAKALRKVLNGDKVTERALLWAGLSTAVLAKHVSNLDKKITAAEKKAEDTKTLKATLEATEKRAEEERKAAEARAVAERKAAEERAAAEKKAAEESAAAEKKAADEAAAAAAKAAADEAARNAAAEAERLRNLPAPAPNPAPYVAPAPQPYVPPAPSTKYTGPRCYAPGGKTWRPC